MTPRGSSQTLLRFSVGAAVLLACFGGGLALGRSTAGAASTSRSTSSGTPLDTSASVLATADGPTRMENGVPVGYTHTQRGAAAAATTYATVLGGSLLVDPAGYRAAVTEMTAPAAADAVVSAASLSRDKVDSLFNLSQLTASGTKVAVQTVPVSMHVDSYTDSVAVVRLWSLGLFAVDGKRSPFEVWSTGTYTLEWTGSDWRLASSPTSVDGPTPTVGGVPSTDATLPEQLRTFQGYGYVPR